MCVTFCILALRLCTPGQIYIHQSLCQHPCIDTAVQSRTVLPLKDLQKDLILTYMYMLYIVYM